MKFDGFFVQCECARLSLTRRSRPLQIFAAHEKMDTKLNLEKENDLRPLHKSIISGWGSLTWKVQKEHNNIFFYVCSCVLIV